MTLYDRIRRAAWPSWLGRCGFFGRGLVYLVAGVFIVHTASTAQTAQGWQGAFLALRELPGGVPAVFVMAVALGTFIAWRLIEALLDPEQLGADLRGLALRGVRMVSALAYGFLTWKALTVLLCNSASSSDSATRHATALAMSEPLGRGLVLIAGLVVTIIGLVQLARSFTLDVHKRLGLADQELSTWLSMLGRLGLACRGLVFMIIGAFLVYAAWFYQPDKARAMSGALRTIAEQPYGDWLLGATGVGLAAFGLFSLAMARYRHFTCGDAAHSARASPPWLCE